MGHLWRLPPECLAIWRWTWSRGQAIKQGVKQHVKQHVRPKKRTPKKQIQEIEEGWRNRSRHFRTLLDFIGIVSFKFGANLSQCWYLGKSVYTPPPNHSWKQILPVPDSSSIFVISFSTKQLQRCALDRRAAAQIAKKMPRIKIEISANVERRKTGRDIPKMYWAVHANQSGSVTRCPLSRPLKALKDIVFFNIELTESSAWLSCEVSTSA